MRRYLNGIRQGEAGADAFPARGRGARPLMLKLSGELTQGALPYNTTRKHTAEAAKILGPAKWCAIEQKVTLETDPAKARALGRKELARYMTLDNYRNNWLRIGFTEADLADGGSDAFIDQMVLWGDAGQSERRPARAFRGRSDPCGDPTGARRGRHRRARSHPDDAGRHMIDPSERHAS